jgi:hypothetical protein
MPLFESQPGVLGVVVVADGLVGFEHEEEGLVAGRTGGGICVAFAGVAVFLLGLVLGSVFVGVGAVVGFGQFAVFMCASPGCGCVHSALFRLLFELGAAGDVGLVTVGLVCA